MALCPEILMNIRHYRVRCHNQRFTSPTPYRRESENSLIQEIRGTGSAYCNDTRLGVGHTVIFTHVGESNALTLERLRLHL